KRCFYEFGSYRMDVGERQLLRGDQRVPLTVKAFETLLALVENAGRALEKDELLRRVWPDSFVEEGSLTQYISVLRKVLGGDDGQYHETLPKRGYRFVAPIRQRPQGESFIEDEHTLTRVTTEIETTGWQLPSKRVVAGAILFLLTAGGIAYVVTRRASPAVE